MVCILTLDNLLQMHTKAVSRRVMDSNCVSHFNIEGMSIGRFEVSTSPSAVDMSTTLLSAVNIQWGKKYIYTIDKNEYPIVFSNASQYHPAILHAVSKSLPSRLPKQHTPYNTISSEIGSATTGEKPQQGVLKAREAIIAPTHPRRRLQCDCCGLWPAAFSTYEDRLIPKSSALFCHLCYHMLHYSPSGELVYEHLVFEVPEENLDIIS